MCDLSDGFKLCTCEPEAKEFDWVLEYRDPSIDMSYIRGITIFPRFSEDEQEMLEWVLLYLNETDCFDFDYKPAQDDVLTLTIKQKDYRFQFINKDWTFAAEPMSEDEMLIKKKGMIEIVQD